MSSDEGLQVLDERPVSDGEFSPRTAGSSADGQLVHLGSDSDSASAASRRSPRSKRATTKEATSQASAEEVQLMDDDDDDDARSGRGRAGPAALSDQSDEIEMIGAVSPRSATSSQMSPSEFVDLNSSDGGQARRKRSATAASPRRPSLRSSLRQVSTAGGSATSGGEGRREGAGTARRSKSASSGSGVEFALDSDAGSAARGSQVASGRPPAAPPAAGSTAGSSRSAESRAVPKPPRRASVTAPGDPPPPAPAPAPPAAPETPAQPPAEPPAGAPPAAVQRDGSAATLRAKSSMGSKHSDPTGKAKSTGGRSAGDAAPAAAPAPPAPAADGQSAASRKSLPPPRRSPSPARQRPSSRAASSPGRSPSPRTKAERKEAERIAAERCEKLYKAAQESREKKKLKEQARVAELTACKAEKEPLKLNKKKLKEMLSKREERIRKLEEAKLEQMRRQLREGLNLRLFRAVKPIDARPVPRRRPCKDKDKDKDKDMGDAQETAKQHRWVEACVEQMSVREGCIVRLLSAEGPRGARPAMGDDLQRVVIPPLGMGCPTERQIAMAEEEGLPPPPGPKPVLLEVEVKDSFKVPHVWVETEGCEMLIRADCFTAERDTSSTAEDATRAGVVLLARNEVMAPLQRRRQPNSRRPKWVGLSGQKDKGGAAGLGEWPVGAMVHIEGTSDLGRVRGDAGDGRILVSVPFDSLKLRRVDPEKLRLCDPAKVRYGLQVAPGVLPDSDDGGIDSPGVSPLRHGASPRRSVHVVKEEKLQQKYSGEQIDKRRHAHRVQVRSQEWDEAGCTFRPYIGGDLCKRERLAEVDRQARKLDEQYRRGRCSRGSYGRSVLSASGTPSAPSPPRRSVKPPEEPPDPPAKPKVPQLRLTGQLQSDHVLRLKGYRAEADEGKAPHIVSTGVISCRNPQWQLENRDRRRRQEEQELENAKRRDNPTYCAMQEWIEARQGAVNMTAPPKS